jgi:hypothetical protein
MTVLLVGAAPLTAQNPQMRRQQLQQQVMQRFLTNFKTQAGLSDAQFERFQGVIRQSFEGRAELMREERQLWVALEGQMRPGVAADADSVDALIDGILSIQEELTRQARAQQEEYASFLNPVQRAQLTLAWRRFQMQIERVRGMGQQQQQRRPM